MANHTQRKVLKETLHMKQLKKKNSSQNEKQTDNQPGQVNAVRQENMMEEQT